MDEEDDVSRSDPAVASVEGETTAEPTAEFAVLKPVSYEIEGVACAKSDGVTNEHVDAVSPKHASNDVNEVNEQVNDDVNEPVDESIGGSVATIGQVEDDVSTEVNETAPNDNTEVDVDASEQLNDDSAHSADDAEESYPLDETGTPPNSSFATSCNETNTADEEMDASVDKTKLKRRYQRKVYRNVDPSGTPGESRYGRVRKPKLASDFISVDRKSFAVLNSSSYKHVFAENEEAIPTKIAKITSPAKVAGQAGKGPGRPRKVPGRGRGRPRKVVPNVDNVTEVVPKTVDSADAKSDVDEEHSVDDESSINSINLGTMKTYSKLSETSTVSTPEASQDGQQEGEKTTTTPQVNYPELDWRVGDIAWARIGCYPYWPSIVTLEYGSSIYVKPAGKRGRLAVHVQFFGDRGRRSWVLTSSLIKYKSKEQFMELKRQYKKDKFRFKNFNVFRMKDLWNKSISEADTILKLPYEERIQHYQTMYPVSEESYVAELANASKVKPSIRKLKNMKHRRRGRRKIIDGDARNMKRPVQPASADGTNENLTISTDSASSTALDDASKPLKKRKRKPLDEHIKKRRAFERRLKKVLQESEHVRPKNTDRQGNKNSAKSKNARFNALLKSGGANAKLPPSSADLSHLSEEKKSALSVYDFESDEETEVFMSYNSRFSAQVLPRIEKSADSSENDDCAETEAEKADEKATVETESTATEKSAEATDNAAVEDTKRTEVVRRGRGRPKGSKNAMPSAGRRRPKQVGQVAGVRRRKGASLFVRRRQPAGAVKQKSNGVDAVAEMKESPVGLVCGIEDLQKINKLISMEDEQSSDEDEYKSTEDEKLKSSSSDKTPSTCVEKRSSLFAGMKNERVCCICEKAGDTVRCRGPCSGTYHVECERKLYATEAADEVTPKPRRGRKPRKSVPAAKDDEVNVETAKEEAIDGGGATKTTDASEGHDEKEEAGAEKTVAKVEESKTTLAAEDTTAAERMEVDEPKTEEAVENAPTGPETPDEADEKKVVEAKAESGEETEEKVEDEGAAVKTEEETNDEEAAERCNTIVESDATTNSVEFRCKKCTDGEPYPCFTCGRVTQEKTGETERFSCCLQYCGRVYHKECLKAWPQAMWVQSSLSKQIRNGSASTAAKETLLCPQHYCHTCISEDPAFLKNKENKARLVRCIRCPTAYHKRVHCIPAGTEILSLTEIICPRHYEPPPGAGHCNTNWCCICCIGGSLICCEDCPMAFHAECLNLPPEEYEGRYICEDCQNGRFLLYGEVAWVKLGHYRWWPAQILYPSQVPDNIRNIVHRRGEFAVRFFGSNNYNWISRGRSFVYQDGDSGKNTCGKRSVDVVFVKALEEAKEAYQLMRIAKAARDKEHRAGMKPPKYGRISANKPIGNVRIVELNTSNITACECDPKSERPCAPDSDCLNRMLLVECNPAVCVAGERCLNQAFEKRVYPPLMPFKTEKRGWGLKALVDLKKGDFIIEYVGEMITEEEYQRRLNIMHQNQEVNYYFLTIDKDRMLDAGPRGNVSRFMNHSCDPNCETQKWTVNGDTRVGLFALKNVPANTELTFNYNLVSQGNEMKPCHCGSDKCAGFIGLRPTKQNGSITNNDDETRKKSSDDNRKKSVENGNGDARKLTGRKRGRPRLDSKPSTPAPAPSTADESGAAKSTDHEQTATPGEPPKKRKRFRKPSIVQNAAAAATEPSENNAVSPDENAEPAVGTVPVSDLPPKKRECAGKASETSTVDDGVDAKNSTDDAVGEKATPAVDKQPPIKRGRGRPKKTIAKTGDGGNAKPGRRLVRKKLLMKKRRAADAEAKAKPLTNGEKKKKVIAVAKKRKANAQKPETKSEQEKQESLFRMLKQRIDTKFIEMSSIDGLEKKNRVSDANGGYAGEKRNSDVEKTTEKRSDRESQDAQVSRPNKIEKDGGKNASEAKPSLNNVVSKDNDKRKSTNSSAKKIIKKSSAVKKMSSDEKRKESSTKESGKKSASLVKRVLNEKRSEPLAVTKPSLKKKKIVLVKKKKLNPSVRTKQEDSVVIKKVKKDDAVVKKKVIRLVGKDGKHLIRKKKKLVTNKTSKSNGTIPATIGADSVEWKAAKVEEEKMTADEKEKIEDVTMEYAEESEIIDSDTFIEEYHPEDFPPADRVEENSVETTVVESTNRKLESDDSFVSCELAPEDYKEKEICDKDDDDVASDDEIVNLEVEEVDDGDEFCR